MDKPFIVKAFRISEEPGDYSLKFNLYDSMVTRLNITSITIDPGNMRSFRYKLNMHTIDMPDLYIFEVNLQESLLKKVANSIRQLMPDNVPAAILSKPKNPVSNKNITPERSTIINASTTHNINSVRNTINNFWNSIV